jgi:hypothetical protein
MKKYYCYAYLRKDGSPYYIGKGTGKRIHSALHTVNLPLFERRIILKDNLTNTKALELEKQLILKYGRKEFGGILHNKTDGGENPPIAKKGQQNRIDSLQNFWNTISEEERKKRGEKISATKKKAGTNNLPTISVFVVELNQIFTSIKLASIATGADHSHISKCLRGKAKSSNGYHFKRVTNGN